MSCNYCGEEYGVKMYYCEGCDNDICENCTEAKVKNYCNNIDYHGTKCEYTDRCKIYKLGSK